MVYAVVKTQVPEPTTKAINIRTPSGLLDLIDAAANASALDRSSWIRLACSEKLGQVREKEAHPSMNDELIKDPQVADPRARAVIKDLLLRIDRLEGAVFSSEKADPFEE